MKPYGKSVLTDLIEDKRENINAQTFTIPITGYYSIEFNPSWAELEKNKLIRDNKYNTIVRTLFDANE